MNSIFTRRSIRNFHPKEVETQKIELMLKAAMQAPSAANRQPWKFIVVTGKENLTALSKYNPYASSLKNANVGIIVLGDTAEMAFPELWQQDLGAATQNILLQATELGLGAVWYGTAPYEERIKFIQKLYNLGDNLIPYSVIAIGYPLKENANHFIDRFAESKVRYIK